MNQISGLMTSLQIMPKLEKLKAGYLAMFERLIDAAFDGEPQVFMFCEGVVLELYLDGDELHWRKYGEENR